MFWAATFSDRVIFLKPD